MLGRLVRRANALLDARDERLHEARLLRTYGETPVEVDGLKLRVPREHIGLAGAMVGGDYEAAERRFVDRYVREGDRVLEVGGGLGLVTCLLARRAGAERLTTVEPVPENAAAIRENLALNGLTATVVERFVTYDGKPVRRGESALAHATSSGGDVVDVEGATVAELVAAMDGVPDVVVMDAEGAEFDVVRHDLAELRDAGARLIVEAHPGGDGARAADFLQRLVAGGYALDEVEADGGGLFHVVAHPA